MMFLMENWYLVVALMAVAGMVGVCIGRFLKMPTSEQRERVKEWLLWAVTQAEAELGSGAAADCEGQEGESWRIWSRRPAWEKEDSRTDVEELGDVERVRRDVGEEGYKVVFERFDQTVQLQVREVRNGDGVWIENHLIQTLFGPNV